ncbi:FAD-dependent oxidoreductase [Hoeflea poritis]|uniref:FAD-dependent oxidoreductase n=1 Tax=Hoeflea poritis TaxID=2993659 RepID=A0ABT4VUZ5_9HYPH|nr:FAD-dependent oxidoreductase [Hoeflea poritis]MDA4848521.1 FAD-dependent oxidoreductase [Hoeflea poritis]
MTNDVRIHALEECELLVLGGGLAGHSAALEAAGQGFKVLLVEKNAEYGGSTVQSSGSFAFAGTAAQRAAGFEDTAQTMADDIMAASGNAADPQLVSLYMEHQSEAFDWLLANGVVFHPVTLSSNQSVPRTHATDPQQLMDALHQRVLDDDRITYLNNASATNLYVDGDGRVSGATIDHNGLRETVNARLGVVIATGGFSRNAELIAKFAPSMARALRLGGEGNSGDGLLMAWKLGADFVDTAFLNGTFGVSLNNYPEDNPPKASEALLRLAIYRGAVAVNLNGERFADESISYKKLGEICLDQQRSIGFQVWDQSIMDQSRKAPNANDFEGALELGLVKKADTIEALAELVGLDGNVLTKTIEKYNRDVDAGGDTVFGRTSLGRGWGTLSKIDSAPFYIYPCTTAMLATYCGLRVTRNMEVLDVFGNPIEGLFAAGECVGGFHGSGYMSGSSLSKSVIFGRVAANGAIRQKPVK